MSAPSVAAPLPYTAATWAFTLHVAGVRSGYSPVSEACDGVALALDRATGSEAAEALVAAIGALLPDGPDGGSPARVVAAARTLYGDRVRTDLGEGDRESRVSRIRKYQFATQLPWLARAWTRQDGVTAPRWILVERVTDEVAAADANPWNAVDERFRIPLADFHVMWELDGATSVHLAP